MENQYFTLIIFLTFKVSRCSFDQIPEKIACCDPLDLIDCQNNFVKVIDVNDGETIKLLCSFCSGNLDNGQRTWYYKKRRCHQHSYDDTKLYHSDETNRSKVIIDSKKILTISKFNHNEDSGIYSCMSNTEDQVIFTYILDGVFNESVKPFFGSLGFWTKYKMLKLDPVNQQFENPSKEPFISFRNTSSFSFRVTTYWEDWGSCQASANTGASGIRITMGKCRLRVVPNNHFAEEFAEIENGVTNGSYLDQKYDLPCRSKMLYEILPEISNFVRTIPDYKAISKCIFDRKLLKMETDEDKFKSTFTKQVPESGHCVLACLNGTTEYKVEWYKNNILLNSSQREAMGYREDETLSTRDSFNTLYIFHATKADEGVYHCVINGKNMNRYIVKVFPKCGINNDDFFRYSIYLGFVLLLTTTCYFAGICVAWHERGSFADPLNLNMKKEKRRL